MTEFSALAALAAGAVALLSPCSALLLPAFFAYAFGSRTALVGRTVVFTIGLTLTLVPLGTGMQLASRLFYGHRDTLVGAAGWFIIALGVLQVMGGSFGLPFVGKLHARASATQARDTGHGVASWLATLALGATYGLAGFCSGPALGAILTIAATSPTPWTGGLLLAWYAVGMALPLFALAALWDRFDLGRRSWLRGRSLRVGPLRLHSTSLLAGVMFISIGLVFLRYDGTAGLVAATGIDTTDVEFAAQQAVKERLGGTPSWVLAVLVALAAGAVAWRRSRGRDTDGRDAGAASVDTGDDAGRRQSAQGSADRSPRSLH
ncbi:MAG: cytochrome c biogenesis protein CcdA [Austwickia sp.]|nr:cytochrome c biogenesis protein CcdA [Austwickia sp.]